MIFWTCNHIWLRLIHLCHLFQTLVVQSFPLYDIVIENVGVELKLTQAETEGIKLAKNTDKTVKALEKFEQNLDGFFYFGRIATKKRHNGNMDLAIVLHGFRWNLEAQVKEDGTGEIKRFLQSMTPKKKDIFKKHFRSKAVETFSEICEPELLKVVPKPTKRLEKEEEDRMTKKMAEHIVKIFKEKGMPVDFEALMQSIGTQNEQEK